MPRNFNKYQYETSPRKLEPEYTPVKNPYKKKKTTARKVQKTNKNKAREIKKKKMRIIRYIAIGFLIIFGISLRNSQIDENFAKIQDLKTELAEIEKQNAQLEVAIENGMNLNKQIKYPAKMSYFREESIPLGYEGKDVTDITDDYDGNKYQSITDEMYAEKTSGYIEK